MIKKPNPRRSSNLFQSVCDQIVEELQALPKPDGTSQRRVKGDAAVKLKKSVEKFVRDSVSVQFKNPPGYASVHKNANDYSKGALGKYFSHRITVKRAFEGMEFLGYLKTTKAGVSVGAAGRYLTRYEATPKLMGLLRAVDVKILPVLIPPDPDEHPIRVRQNIWVQENGKRIKKVMRLPTPDTPNVEQMTKRLKIINGTLVKNWVDLEISDEEFGEMQAKMLTNKSKGVDAAVSLSKRTLYRVFNDEGLTRGGRFYGAWWQNIPSDYRPYITINGKPMVEYDYSGLHPAILYAERGLAVPEDPYARIVTPRTNTQEGKKEARDVAKKIFNAMINAKKPMKAQPDGIKLSDFGMKWDEVSQAILELHEPIKDAFCSDAGARLQRIDSDMAEEVLLHFAEKRVAVLPVHDSFIIHSGYEFELERVMVRAFERRLRVTPKLKSEPRSARPESAGDLTTSQELEELLEFMSVGHEMRLKAYYNIRQST
ncbi:hypothetical protein [Sulfitobacter geojensis]|uniref:hypothetical protein n=1 Tax=Sulfitobacter geojensis TaxID=1342299 RepID=UPI00248F8520|nr:hypothetical protein [Sulfitobacter geojensis]